MADGHVADADVAGRHVPARAGRLLAVDDETVRRILVTRIGEQLGYASVAAASIEEALATIQGAPPAVVVLDLSLREHDGVELLRELARMRLDPVVVLVSGANPRIREAVQRLGIALGLRIGGALAKPLRREQLARAIACAPRPAPRTPPVAGLAISADDIRAGIERGEFTCHYQPKVALGDSRLIGFEALARWHSARHGRVGPDMFIPLAEKSGMIGRLTRQVLDTALGTLAGWTAAMPELGMAVNLSPADLGDIGFPKTIDELLARFAILPHRLTFELTEGAVMRDYIAAADILTRLRIRGIGVAIDDFGTGYSSLLSLLRLPFRELKIDRSFVRDILTDRDSARIVRSVISLAHEMGLATVVEGIETPAIHAAIRDLGADVGQGYLFGRPLSAADATRLVRGEARA